jgi:hypothetical protein
MEKNVAEIASFEHREPHVAPEALVWAGWARLQDEGEVGAKALGQEGQKVSAPQESESLSADQRASPVQPGRFGRSGRATPRHEILNPTT